MKLLSSIITLVTVLTAAPLLAQWPERGMTLVTSNPETVSWSPDILDMRAGILQSLLPRLSRELGVPVSLVFRPAASGVLAANMVAGAKPDGYIFGALGGDAAMGRVIQDFTPYSWAEFTPVSTAWRTVYALITRADEAAATLRELPQKHPGQKPRLAHLSLEPIEFSTLMALRAARVVGFGWEFVKVDVLNPDYLLEGDADAMVVPLGTLKQYPRLDKLKVLTVFSRGPAAPCAVGLPNLSDQNVDIELNPPFSFYLPAKVNWRIRARLSLALLRAFRQPSVAMALDEACLEPFLEDIDGVSAVLGQEYQQQEILLKNLHLEGSL